MGYERASELLPVEARVKVAEEAVHGGVRIEQLADYLIDPLVNLIEVGVVPGLRLGHGERYPLIVRKE